MIDLRAVFKNRSLILFGLWVGLSACATTKSNHTESVDKVSDLAEVIGPQPEVMGPPELYGPEANGGNADAVGPAQDQTTGVVLVVGPGMARGFAMDGVFKALRSEKIKIRSIYASEVGALVSAIYAQHENINELEWGLQRLKAETFTPKTSLFKRWLKKDRKTEEHDGEELRKQLAEIFSNEKMEKFKIPLWVGVVSAERTKSYLVSRGPAEEVLMATLALPGFIKKGQVPFLTTEDLVSPRSLKPYFLGEARQAEKAKIIVVDLSINPETDIKGYFEGAALVIKPKLDDIDDMDFSKKMKAAYRGKIAAQKGIKEFLSTNKP